MICFRLNSKQTKKVFITMFCSNHFIKCKISHEELSIYMIRKMVYKDWWAIYALTSEFVIYLHNESRLCWDKLICQSSGSRRHIWFLANWMAIFGVGPPRMLVSSAKYVVSSKQGTQDVCMVNKVSKYHSICETVESIHTTVETQRRILC